MYTDGACRGNPGLSGAGIAIMDETNKRLIHGLSHFCGLLTNNQAEYMALIHGLLWFKAHLPEYQERFECTGLDVFCDSRMLVMQILEQHRVRNAKLIPLYRLVRKTLGELPSWSISHIPREENRIADGLAAASLQPYLSAAGTT